MDDINNFLLEEILEISHAVVQINENRKDHVYDASECRLQFLKDTNVNNNEANAIFVRPCEIFDASQPCDINIHYYKKSHLSLPFLCLEKIKNPIIIVKNEK